MNLNLRLAREDVIAIHWLLTNEVRRITDALTVPDQQLARADVIAVHTLLTNDILGLIEALHSEKTADGRIEIGRELDAAAARKERFEQAAMYHPTTIGVRT